MKKNLLIISLLPVFLAFGCGTGSEKSEVTVRIDDPVFIRHIADYNDDPTFMEAFTRARETYNPLTDEFLSVFMDKLTEICPDCRLAAYFYTYDLSSLVNFEDDNLKYLEVIRAKTATAKAQAVEVLRQRLENAGKQPGKFGGRVTATAAATGAKDEYILTINRKPDPQRIREILETDARFEVWETYQLPEILEYLIRIDALIKDPSVAERIGIEPVSPEFGPGASLFRYLRPNISDTGEPLPECTIGYASITDTALVNRIFTLDDLSWFMPHDLRVMWDNRPAPENQETIRLVAVKINTRDRRSEITETDFLKAELGKGTDGWFVDFSLDPMSAGHKWANLTAYNLGLQLALTVNGTVMSTPLINDKITGNTIRIDGFSSPEEAADIAVLLGSGYMPPFEAKVTDVK